MSRYVIFILVILMAFIAACDNEPIETPDVFTGKEYFPLQTGNTLIYKVTEITIDKPSDYYDTSVYYLKEIT